MSNQPVSAYYLIGCRGLNNLGASSPICDEIESSGAIPPLVGLLSHSADGVVEKSAAALANLAADSGKRRATIVGEGAIPVLVRGQCARMCTRYWPS